MQVIGVTSTSKPERFTPPLGQTVSFATLVDALRHHATVQPDRLAFRFLEGDTEIDISYGALHGRAMALAARLVELGAHGGIVYLTFPPGLDFIVAFFGCLYAGAITVPTFPPFTEATMARFEGMVKAARPLAIVSAPEVAVGLQLGLPGAVQGVHMVTLDAVGEPRDKDWQPPTVTAENVAFLQFTSGSTAVPKGVILTQGNLMHDIELMRTGYGLNSDAVGVSWLPPYHDMGLIGSILYPLVTGFPVMLTSPLSVLGRPLRWLQIISRYRGSISASPNFFYELCARKATPADVAALDLSSWVAAVNGAEMIRSETLERFSRTFAGAGFRREAFLPAYGLAEAAVYVSSARPSLRSFDRTALEAGICVEPTAGAPKKTLVACGGRSPEGEDIAVVDPVLRKRFPEGRVGEIWVAGAHVARGYWGMAEETERVFGARIEDEGEQRYLRTGDLGAYYGGELFVVGRIKEIIILRGRNIYPTDVELAVEKAHPAVRPGCVAAFAVERAEGQGGERLVVVAEVDRRKAADLDEVLGAIRAAVTAACEVAPHAIVLVNPHTVQKTTSGKLMRVASRSAFLAGRLDALATLTAADPARGAPAAAGPAALPDRRHPRTLDEVRVWLVGRLAEQLMRSPAEIDLSKSCAAQGLDSLAAAEVATAAEEALGIPVSMTLFRDERSVDEIAELLVAPAALAASLGESAPRAPVSAPRSVVPPEPPRELPPPRHPRALWPFAAWARAVYGLRARGVENVPRGPSLICPNHESHLDVFLVASLLPPEIASRLCCFAKREHFDSPVMRPIARLARAIPLDRDGEVRGALQLGGEALRAGRPILIHPEGTRTRTGEMLPFRAGPALLALQHQVPLVPVRIRGAYDIYPATRSLPRLFDWQRLCRLRIEVAFGKPIRPPAIAFRPGDAGVRRAIDELTRELRAAVVAL